MGSLGRNRAGQAGGRARSGARYRSLWRRQDAEQPDPAQARARAASGREAEARRIRSHRRARARRDGRAGEDASMTMAGLIVALAGCLVVQAFFAASEIALVSADDLKVRAGSEGEGYGSR